MNDISKNILLSQLNRVEPKKIVSSNSAATTERKGDDFEKVLQQQSSVQLSKHAEKRLQSRKIELTATDRDRLDQAVGALEKKGARDSLVLMGDLAFIVNVPSKTVVTALAKEQMKEQVFTNIDSTMLV